MKLCSVCLYSGVVAPILAKSLAERHDSGTKALTTECKEILKTITQNKRKYPPVYMLDVTNWGFTRIDGCNKGQDDYATEKETYVTLLSRLLTDEGSSIDFYLLDLVKEADLSSYELTASIFPTKFAFSIGTALRTQLELRHRTAMIVKELGRVDDLVCETIANCPDEINRYVEARAYTQMMLGQLHKEIMAFTLNIKATLQEP